MLKRFIALTLSLLMVLSTIGVMAAPPEGVTALSENFDDATLTGSSGMVLVNQEASTNTAAVTEFIGGLDGNAEDNLAGVLKVESLPAGSKADAYVALGFLGAADNGTTRTSEFRIMADGPFDAIAITQAAPYCATVNDSGLALLQDGTVMSNGSVVSDVTYTPGKWADVVVTLSQSFGTYTYTYSLNGTVVGTKTASSAGWIRMALITSNDTEEAETGIFMAVDDHLFWTTSNAGDAVTINFDDGQSGKLVAVPNDNASAIKPVTEYIGGLGGKAESDMALALTVDSLEAGAFTDAYINLFGLDWYAPAVGMSHTVEFDVYMEGLDYMGTAQKYPYAAGDTGFLTFKSDGTTAARGGAFGDYTPGTWSKRIAITLTTVASGSYRVNYYYDGYMIGTTAPTGWEWMRFAMSKKNNGTETITGPFRMAIDNYSYYTGTYAADGIRKMDFNYMSAVSDPAVNAQTSIGGVIFRNGNHPNSIGATQELAGGLGGRRANDKSWLVNVPALTVAATDPAGDGVGAPYGSFANGYFGMNFPSGSIADGTVITGEFSVLMTGDFTKMALNVDGANASGGNSYYRDVLTLSSGAVINGTVIRTDEWYHIAYTVSKAAGGNVQFAYYFNGAHIGTYDLGANTVGFRNLAMTYNTNDWDVGGGVKAESGYALDDYKLYYGEYVRNEARYTVSDGVEKYGNFIKLKGGETAEDILGAITFDGSVKLYADKTYTTELTGTDAVTDGAVVVMTADNSKYYYLNAVSDHEEMVLIERDFNNGETLAMADLLSGDNGSTAVSHIGGLFGKTADDKAYVLSGTSNGVAGSGGRYQLNLTNYEDMYTTEFSVAASKDSGFSFWASFWMDAEQNSRGTLTFIYMDAEGNVSIPGLLPGKDTGIFKKDEWIRVAMTFDKGENGAATSKLYLNGELYAEQQLGNFYDFRYITLSSPYAQNGVTGDVFTAIDDYTIYYGAYYDDPDNAATLTSEVYLVEDDNIYVPKDMTYDGAIELYEFFGNVTGCDNISVYTDRTYETMEEEGAYVGDIVVAASKNGLVRRYYNILYQEAVVDAEITTAVDGVAGNILTAGTLSASISASAPQAYAMEGVLIMAIAKDGVLQEVKMDAKTITGATEFEVSYNLADTTGVTVKTMFLNGLGNIVPYVPAKSFVAVPVE